MITYIIIYFFGILFMGWEFLLIMLAFAVIMAFFVACFPDWFDDWM